MLETDQYPNKTKESNSPSLPLAAEQSPDSGLQERLLSCRYCANIHVGHLHISSPDRIKTLLQQGLLSRLHLHPGDYIPATPSTHSLNMRQIN